ncbi:Stk1 family PASTA domain-containing Ser/Thr kinase [Arthrobacter agilis]|uniref:Stk1 family PASTA domain-containing Ser/Thr kinase n=1 Tax=Arthrobacter agilis TaxID=37921 RepID=UPI000B35D36D|nr:Stk1 family PASTA domain-containing Ser/Thr kinase [Arthrobacter agilis]OUM42314.1 serine/threonine protein kinase [Arthrobacter agilis]PPB45657.1 Stk1 family PASTA domain-containing Ser/Thr kinase [Arthrobacter agilis]TPV26361.1 Stk1 family PASTA domain-containing Ser/Thr kinase [Arthrobacter agilis]VDR30771.1 Serine/threonine-protein kinase pknB [Arthrobacter agilis]
MTGHRVLDGRYEVLELIGRGGMADVHLGRDLRLGRSVAIKVLRQDLARDPLFQSRFRREAQAVAGLNNPNIVAVYDTGEEEIPDRPQHEVRVPFIVMEYVAGRTLRDHVKAGDLTPEDSVTYLAGVLGALEYSHKAGIVHRDIKPANVMITPEHTVKVMDFGIARAMADSQATMTQTQAVLGTAQYLSPEQARGETVDARSDLYSAGCLLFELLTGRPPFVGDSPVSVAYQHVREEPPTASSLNPRVTAALDSVLARALRKDREERFQDAASFRSALLDAGRGIVLSDAAGAATEAMDVASPRTRAGGLGRAGVVAGAAAGSAIHSPDPETRMMDRVSAIGPDDGGVRAGSGTEHAASRDGRPDVLGPREETDPRQDQRRGSSRAGWITVFCVAVLLVLVGGYVVLTTLTARPETPEVASVTAPEVVGLSEAEAEDAIEDTGLTASSDEAFNATVDAGNVISSDPAGGASVAPDSRVTITVSRGPANVVLPDTLAGLTESSARDALEELGLKGGDVTEESSADVSGGRVITTNPRAGETVPVGSSVDLVLSNGRVTVPLLTDLTVDQAQALLADPAVQLPSVIEEVENSVVAPGIVTAQSEPARSEVAQGTRITITVAKAPAPAPAPETPSDAPSDTPGDQPTEGSGDEQNARPTEDGA